MTALGNVCLQSFKNFFGKCDVFKVSWYFCWTIQPFNLGYGSLFQCLKSKSKKSSSGSMVIMLFHQPFTCLFFFLSSTCFFCLKKLGMLLFYISFFFCLGHVQLQQPARRCSLSGCDYDLCEVCYKHHLEGWASAVQRRRPVAFAVFPVASPGGKPGDQKKVKRTTKNVNVKFSCCCPFHFLFMDEMKIECKIHENKMKHTNVEIQMLVKKK